MKFTDPTQTSKRETLGITTICMKTNALSCVNVEPSIMGSTHNQDKHNRSASGSPTKHEPAKSSPEIKPNQAKDLSANSQEGARQTWKQKQAQPNQ